MTSHRTTTKILLTALLITLTTGTAAAQSIEITSPADGSYHNDSFDVTVEVSNLDSGTTYDIILDSNASIDDSRTDVSEGEYSFTASGLSESSNAYSITAELQRSSDSGVVGSNVRYFYYDTSAPTITEGSASSDALGDGSVDVTWSADDNMELGRFELEKSGSQVASQGAGGTSAGKTLTDENENNTYPEANYNLIVYDRAGNKVNQSFGPVEINDSQGPQIVNQNPSEDSYVSTDSPTVEVSAEDMLSGVLNISLSVNGENNSITGIQDSDSSSIEVALENLEQTTYSPEVTAYDQESNRRTVSWEFTVDTQKPDPSASLTPNPEEQDYLTTETPIGVEVDSGDVSSTGVDRVECFVDSPNDYGYDFGESSTYEDGSFRCGNLNPADYSEGSHSIYVKFYDRAGNSEQRNLGDYVFDTQAPAISDLTITPEYTNVEPNVTVEGSDSGSGLQDAEYMFSDSVDEGEGSSVSASFEDGELVFQPNLRNKEDGDYELYVRVQDGSGKWSDLSSATFTLDRGALPQPDLQVDVLNITSGSETNFEVTVENNGKVPLMDATLEFSNGVEGSLDGVEVQGESSQTYSVPVSTDRSFGKLDATLTLTASTVSDNVTVPVNVMASEEQMNQVDSRIEEYNGRLSALKANLSRLEEEGASQQLLDDMRADIQTFESGLETIKASAVDNNYYEIASELEEVETQKSQAVNTTEEVKTQYRENQRQFWMIIFGLAFLGLAGGGVFVYLRSDYYIDMDDLPVNLDNVSFGDMDWDETVDKVEEKLDNLFGGEGDAEESPDSKDLSWD